MKNLLKKRFEVINDYPNSPHPIGEIMESMEFGKLELYKGNKSCVYKGNPEKYPHIFRPMSWYEQRNKIDLPNYIKLNRNDRTVLVVRVSEWKIEDGRLSYTPDGQNESVLITVELPSTLEEYLSYKDKMHERLNDMMESPEPTKDIYVYPITPEEAFFTIKNS